MALTATMAIMQATIGIVKIFMMVILCFQERALRFGNRPPMAQFRRPML